MVMVEKRELEFEERYIRWLDNGFKFGMNLGIDKIVKEILKLVEDIAEKYGENAELAR